VLVLAALVALLLGTRGHAAAELAQEPRGSEQAGGE
jgi:hypothetical protein